jgi:hypothetical protein
MSPDDTGREAKAPTSHLAEGRRIVSCPDHWQVLPTLLVVVIAVSFAAHKGLTASAVLGLVIAVTGLAFLGMQVAYSSRPTTSALGKFSPFGAWGMLVLGFLWFSLVAR